jgi:DNA-binding Lrp family transcriptional regulator
MSAAVLSPAEVALLSDFQRAFPLVPRPFAAVARALNRREDDVLAELRRFHEQGQISRVGVVWERGAGGAAALCALALPPRRLEAAAEIVSREPAVNHNYEREHGWNLWYVVTGPDRAQVRATADRLAQAADAPALFLPMVRHYRVDLGFDLRGAHAEGRRAGGATVANADERPLPVGDDERPLAALLERGLPLVPQPYDALAERLGWSRDAVLDTLRRWLRQGTVRRFGVVVRHHDVGFAANAMTVVQAPPSQADAAGLALAAQTGVTLAYRRVTDPRWPYNLYFMVHGRERDAVQGLIDRALAAAGAADWPHATLFCARRFKQTGGAYFPAEAPRATSEQVAA